MNNNAREMVNTVTAKASTMKAWKAAVRRMVALFGESAIYYVNCDRFITEGDEDEDAYALPYEQWEAGKKIHYGLQVQHSYYDEDVEQYFSYGDEVVLLA